MFPTGYGPLRLSPSGKLGDPEVCSSVPPSSVRRIWLSVMWRTVRAMQLSPYRAGVAGPYHTRLLLRPAFRPCSCPLALSGPGQAVASKSSALNFGLLWRQFTPCVTRRTVSLHPAQASRRPCEGPVSSQQSAGYTILDRSRCPYGEGSTSGTRPPPFATPSVSIPPWFSCRDTAGKSARLRVG